MSEYGELYLRCKTVLEQLSPDMKHQMHRLKKKMRSALEKSIENVEEIVKKETQGTVERLKELKQSGKRIYKHISHLTEESKEIEPTVFMNEVKMLQKAKQEITKLEQEVPSENALQIEIVDQEALQKECEGLMRRVLKVNGKRLTEIGHQHYMIQAIPSSRDLLIFDCRNGRSRRAEIVDVQIPLMSAFLNLNSSAMMAGGLRDANALNQFVQFFRTKQTAQRLSPLKCAKYGSAITSIKQEREVYLLGGRTAKEELKDVEKYDRMKQRWKRVASLERRRFLGAACANDPQIVFIFGGESFAAPSLLTIERYEVNQQQWSIFEIKMSLPQSSFSISLIKDKFILFGGDSQRGSFEISTNNEGKVEDIKQTDKDFAHNTLDTNSYKMYGGVLYATDKHMVLHQYLGEKWVRIG